MSETLETEFIDMNGMYKKKPNSCEPRSDIGSSSIPGPNHDGGKLVICQDHFLYTVIGDLNHQGRLQNIKNGSDPDDTSVIFRVSPNDGSADKYNPFINDPNIAMLRYYVYGIRNSLELHLTP